MAEVLYSPKVKPEHLARKAIVYLRQSSDKQVRQNQESQRLQYQVAERMRALGWKQVETIDSDLGSSAAMASARREGFERVLSSVALGEVGIVGSREVSRLSRTDKDWCRLLEVCQIFGTLIADEQQVYDLNYLDDQLVLGIKGTLSVVELKVLRQRLQAGQESKARRGQLFKRLPVGYVRDSLGKVVFYPDRRVCEALQLVFAKFRERWSVRQTFQWFRDHDVELPANPIQGTRLVWKIPSQSLVRDILGNPFYAGAYVWGRRPMATLLIEGRLEKRQGTMRRAEDCRVFIPHHHVGYIDWATYEENRRMIQRNSVNWEGDEVMTAIRAGQGLLAGLLRCGHCGRKLHVRYWGGRGTHARYLCKGDYDDGGKYCLGFGGASVDRRLGQELLKVISPLGVEASLKALAELRTGDVAQRVTLSSKLEQLEYEARKACEQYDAVDARNRLVAGELERRWNEKLEEVESTKQALASLDGKRYSLSPDEEARIRWMGENFAEIWQSDRCPPTLKKMIFRTLTGLSVQSQFCDIINPFCALLTRRTPMNHDQKWGILMAQTVKAVQLNPSTVEAFETYIRAAEAGIEASQQGSEPFLWSDASSERAQQVRQGKIAAERWSGNESVKIQDGLIHDWIGAVFISATTVKHTLALLQDYNNHKHIYKPDVIDSRLVGQQDNDFQIYLRILKKKIITVVLDTDHDVHYSPVDSARWFCRSLTTRIPEVENAGKPSEKVLPADSGHGFLWRLASYWRFQERDGGVYVECRALSLTREIPKGLAWIIEPIVAKLPKQSLINTLMATRQALSAGAAQACFPPPCPSSS